MRTLSVRKFADSVSSVGSMILFLIFALFSLIIVAAGASTYSRISGDFGKTFSSSTAVKYVTNKIRSGDSAVIQNGGKGIAIYNGDMVCVIMSTDEGIAERTVKADTYRDFAGGETIFPGGLIKITEREDGLYAITAYSDDNSYTALCRNKG